MRDQLRTAVAGGLGRRALWVAAFAVAIVGGVAVGAVRSNSAPGDQPVFVQGTLTYSWHGDPARGCATTGLCGAHGSIVVHFDGFGDLTIGRHGDSASLGGDSAVVRVRRDDPTPGAGACVDLLPLTGVDVEIRRVGGGGRYLAAIDTTAISAGRCAGPLGREMASARLPARRQHGPNVGFDLHGSESFAGGSFSGTLESTLVLRPDLADQQTGLTGEVTSFTPAPPGPHTGRHVLREFVHLRYRVSGAAGTLQTTFGGAAEPYCATYDDCGVTGSLSFAAHGFGAYLDVVGSRVVTRRVGARAALADLRSGHLSAAEVPPLATMHATVAEALARASGGGCRDVTAAPAALLFGALFGPPPLPLTIPVTLVPPPSGADPLRTHCPGPTGAEVAETSSSFGPLPSLSPLAQGAVPLAALGSRSIFVSLSRPGTFSSPAYSGSRGGSLGFSLTLRSAKAGTRSEAVPR